jgi:dUTP pyrophosphatase
MEKLKCAFLDNRAKLPIRKSKKAAGLDLYCIEYIYLFRNSVNMVRTGIAVEIPPGFEGQVRLRSSICQKGIVIPNAPGTIDSDYRGEIFIPLLNLKETLIQFDEGSRLAQLIISPILLLEPVKVKFEELDVTERGAKGIGSSGIK